MTRINLIHPSKLADQHLFAEFREIKHVPAALKRSMATKSADAILKGIPGNFTLNTGHVKFFMNKIGFLKERHNLLLQELLHRGYNVSEDSANGFDKRVSDVPAEFMHGYTPSRRAADVSKERILLRISEKPEWYRYKGEQKSVEFFKELMENDE